MIVTEIVEVSKAKSKIYIDGEFAFVLYKGELRIYKIKCNEEISEETVRIITEEVLPKRAKLRCMNLLKSRDYTKADLVKKLKQGQYSDEVIEKAIAYVESYHYIDDERYARSYVNYAIQTKSKRQISIDLLKKGVSSDLVNQIFDEIADKSEDSERELILKLIGKKRYVPESATYEEKRKMVTFLYRKGFRLDKIYEILGEME